MKTPLHIVEINHTEKPKGSGGFIIFIYGPSFSPMTKDAKAFWVEENTETALETEYGSQTELKSSIPAQLLAKSGVFGIKVKDDGKESNVLEFVVGTPVPTITKVIPGKKQFNPNQTEPMTIHVNGTNFLPDVIILANGEPITGTRMNSRCVKAKLSATYIKQPNKISITAFNPGTEADESNPAVVNIFDPAVIPPEESNSNLSLPQNTNAIWKWLKNHWFSTLIFALIIFVIFSVYRACSGDEKEQPKKDKEKPKSEKPAKESARYITPEKGIVDIQHDMQPDEIATVWLSKDNFTIIGGGPWEGLSIEPGCKIVRKWRPIGSETAVYDTLYNGAWDNKESNSQWNWRAGTTAFKGIGEGNGDAGIDFTIQRD